MLEASFPAWSNLHTERIWALGLHGLFVFQDFQGIDRLLGICTCGKWLGILSQELSKIQEQANKNVEKQILMLDAIIKMVVAGGRGVDHGEFMSFETTLLSKGQELYFVFFLHQSRDLSFSQDCKKGSLQHQDDLKKLCKSCTLNWKTLQYSRRKKAKGSHEKKDMIHPGLVEGWIPFMGPHMSPWDPGKVWQRNIRIILDRQRPSSWWFSTQCHDIIYNYI